MVYWQVKTNTGKTGQNWGIGRYTLGGYCSFTWQNFTDKVALD